ncbi:Aspartic-type endopeptidase ctsD [Lachnellula arida]|uniref:Aspartic-type endopeptidase ctsD n=1 Tax=Lachnellula arida TaxID=1316785 RepID=A0A8T9BLU3_9HELO|nr:Aspartic-type endopeptidase ctsD [Lachnellula arida]
MLGINFLLVALTFSTSAKAFFYYDPPYRCQLDDTRTCSEEKRAVDSDPLSLKIVQRLPENPNSPQNIQRLADSLKRKYQRIAPSQVERAENDDVVKRTNTHSVVSAAVPSQTNSAGVDQDGTDFSYFAQVQLGSAKTPVYLLLDTGAGTTWVMGTSCTSGPCKTHDTFGSSDSTTFKDLSTPFSISYGSGNVNGTMAQDTLSIAGMSFTASIGIASTASDQFNEFPIDGILGLSMSKSDGQNFWETLAASKTLKSNLVGFAIDRASDGPNTGVINFGSPDTSRFSGSLSYFPSESNLSDDWAVNITNVGVGTTQTGISSLGYIDTGTSFIFAPPADAQKLHASIDGATSSDGSTYTVPCSTTTPLTFSFGQSTYSVSSKDWVSAEVNGVCTSNVYGVGVVDDNSWLIGDTFLKNVYAVFDYDQTRVGQYSSSNTRETRANWGAGFAPMKAVSSSSTTASSTGGSSSKPPTASLMASKTPSTTGTSTPLTTTTETNSNKYSTGTSSGSATTQTTLASSTVSPGLLDSTASTTTQATGKSTGSAASATKNSSAMLLNPSFYSALLAAVTLITLLI